MNRDHVSNGNSVVGLILISLALLLMAPNTVLSQTAVVPPGDGTSTSPYQISQVGHLVWIADNVAASSGKYYTMTADIDASVTATWNDAETDTSILEGFMPIGNYYQEVGFRGVFDGQGHTITGLTIDRPGGYVYAGLFAYIEWGGIVQNLGLLGCTIRGHSYVGGLVGASRGGTFSKIYATGTVTGNGIVGGLVGQMESGTLSDVYAAVVVTGINDVGGLVGMNDSGTVSNAYATGAVTGTGSYIGGLVGSNYSGTVSNSYWDIQTSGQPSSPGGGTGKTTAQMKQQATFTGWDFAGTWGIVESTCYPYLQLSPPPFKLNLTVTGPGQVSVSPSPVNGGYAPGTLVTLTAAPNNFSNLLYAWKGATLSGDLTATVLMDGHKAVVAEFLPLITIDSLTALAKIGNDPNYPLINVWYMLTADIDASETATWNDPGTDTSVLEGFMPIGTFRGIFEGLGHTITGLVINRPDRSCVGLFSYLSSGGMVLNLGLVGGAVTGHGAVGALVGYNSSGMVSHAYATGTVTGHDSVGGLVGECVYATVSNAHAAGAVTGAGYVGGLVGENNSGIVSNAYATGAVMGEYYTGGLVGGNYFGTVSNAYATGEVTGYRSTGGLIGDGYMGTISNAYATGAVTGRYDTGGLIGFGGDSIVSSSYWDIQTSGCSHSDGGTGKTTAQMKQQATFVGWDFTYTWGMMENVSYPVLQVFEIPGDANHDGNVNFSDYLFFSVGFGTTNATWEQGDFNGDQTVNFSDYLILSSNFGSSGGGEEVPAGEVAEPAQDPLTATLPCAPMGLIVLTVLGLGLLGIAKVGSR